VTSMKVTMHRLRRLEQRLLPKADLATSHAVELLRARRRRLLEVEGRPYPERPLSAIPLPTGRSLSIAEVLRQRPRTWTATLPPEPE
jgi:hypothetical protein